MPQGQWVAFNYNTDVPHQHGKKNQTSAKFGTKFKDTDKYTVNKNEWISSKPSKYPSKSVKDRWISDYRIKKLKNPNTSLSSGEAKYIWEGKVYRIEKRSDRHDAYKIRYLKDIDSNTNKKLNPEVSDQSIDLKEFDTGDLINHALDLADLGEIEKLKILLKDIKVEIEKEPLDDREDGGFSLLKAQHEIKSIIDSFDPEDVDSNHNKKSIKSTPIATTNKEIDTVDQFGVISDESERIKTLSSFKSVKVSNQSRVKETKALRTNKDLDSNYISTEDLQDLQDLQDLKDLKLIEKEEERFELLSWQRIKNIKNKLQEKKKNTGLKELKEEGINYIDPDTSKHGCLPIIGLTAYIAMFLEDGVAVVGTTFLIILFGYFIPYKLPELISGAVNAKRNYIQSLLIIGTILFLIFLL